jgi:hypothetical protein
MAQSTDAWRARDRASMRASLAANSRYTEPTPTPASRAMSAMVVFAGP